MPITYSTTSGSLFLLLRVCSQHFFTELLNNIFPKLIYASRSISGAFQGVTPSFYFSMQTVLTNDISFIVQPLFI